MSYLLNSVFLGKVINVGFVEFLNYDFAFFEDRK